MFNKKIKGKPENLVDYSICVYAYIVPIAMLIGIFSKYNENILMALNKIKVDILNDIHIILLIDLIIAIIYIAIYKYINAIENSEQDTD